MAIAFDAAGGGISNPGTGLSWTHTCTGSNLVLVMGCACNAGDHITGATYNGVAMTLVDKQISVTSGDVYTFILVNPATGANTLALTTDSTNTYYTGSSASYTGAKQSGQPDAHGTSDDTVAGDTSFSDTRTSVANNSWHIAYVRQFNGSNPGISVGANTTSRNTQQTANQMLADGNAAITPAGSNSLNFTTGVANTEWASNGLTISPVAAAATVLPFRSLLGVGI